MLSFFRRIRRRITGGNPGRYMLYSIGEIILVVIGILIALQINNWNEHRKERQLEQNLLEQLHRDFTANQKLIIRGLRSLDGDKQELITTLNHMGPKVSLPSRPVLDTIEGIDYTVVELVRSTLNPSLISERIELLENQKLREGLHLFPGNVAIYKENEDACRDLAIKQRQIHQEFTSIIAREFPDEGETTLRLSEENIFDSNHLGWLRSRAYQNIVVDRLWNIRGAARRLESLEEDNKSLLQLIDLELQRFD